MKIAYDASCALDQPRTGVGYAAVHLVDALMRLEAPPEAHIFATRSGAAAHSVPEWSGFNLPHTILRRAGWAKTWAWTHFNAPPIEWFCGPCDIAHGLFHLLPAATRALRMVTIHDLSFIRYPDMHTAETVRIHGALVRHAVRNADAVITVSEHARQEVIDCLGAKPDTVFAVPNGIDTSAYTAPIKPETHAALCSRLGIKGNYVIHVGTLEPRKNLVRLIEAFNRVQTELDGVQLLLVGKAGWKSEPIIEALLAPASRDSIVHAGHLDRKDVVTLLQGARACLYPSLYEGFGLPILEAMAAGTPVLTSSVSAMPEVAGDAALLVDPEDDASLQQGIAKILQDDALRNRLVEAGRRRAAEMTWTRSAERLREVYRKCAGK